MVFEWLIPSLEEDTKAKNKSPKEIAFYKGRDRFFSWIKPFHSEASTKVILK